MDSQHFAGRRPVSAVKFAYLADSNSCRKTAAFWPLGDYGGAAWDRIILSIRHAKENTMARYCWKLAVSALLIAALGLTAPVAAAEAPETEQSAGESPSAEQSAPAHRPAPAAAPRPVIKRPITTKPAGSGN